MLTILGCVIVLSTCILYFHELLLLFSWINFMLQLAIYLISCKIAFFILEENPVGIPCWVGPFTQEVEA
jgi:hypothetical protein